MKLFSLFSKKTKSNKEYPLLEDEKTLPTQVTDFKEWHYKVLRRLNKHSVKEPFSGYMTLQVDIPKFIPILQELDLIKLASYEESLSYIKNDTLKVILKQFNLKISGNKKTLIDRIIQSVNEQDIRKLDEYSDYYILTERGQKLIDESYEKSSQDNLDFFKKSIELILDRNFDEAYRMICKRNAEMPVPPGMNCEWNKWYYRGLTDSWSKISQDLINNTENRLITAASIYSWYSGDSSQRVSAMLEKVYSEKVTAESLQINIRYEESNLRNRDNAKSYMKNGTKKYRFLATLDNRTCSQCGQLDGMVFNISEAKQNVNYPPLHKGCRCTTTAYISDELHAKMKRWARDPVTGKGMEVPADMTYKEWKDLYLNR